ncbi:alpha/beta fold hydrolase [Streptomyces sp. NPDC002039]|uniref:alpha/beta fold hydrolase n=1 Tax=Streptomyces sp. NPDC002039 TaxID=3154660 RepID=UPI003327BD21
MNDATHVTEKADPAARSSTRPVFVLVHGAGGNSYGWAPVLAELALRGHLAVAVDLPGHGPEAYFPRSYQTPQDPEGLRTEPSTTANVTSAHFTDHVADVVRRAHRLGPVVLVGQSMGGLTLNTVANRVPELISHLVYVSAFCPSARATMQQLMTTPEAAASAIFRLPVVPMSAERGVNRVNWRSADPEFLRVVREGMAADRTDDEVRTLLNILEPDESAEIGAADTRGLPESWGRIPRTYLRFTEDRTIPPELQDLMIEEADELTPENPFRVRSLAAPHIGPRDPGELAVELELVAELCR